MQWTEASENWTAMTDAVMARWPEVDADTVADLSGNRAEFNAYLGQIYNLTLREADEQIDEWLQGPMPTDALMDEAHDNASITASGRHIPAGEDVYSEDRDFGDDRLPTTPMGRT